jgi:two-component system NtrC family sensor kinase
VPVARSAALGELAGDIAHDIANSLFGVIGLVDLLLEDAAAGSGEEERLQLVQQTALEMKRTLRLLLGFARAPGGEPREAALGDAARSAVALVRHGVGKSLEIDERYPEEASVVPCTPSELVQAVLHLLLAARPSGRVELEIRDDTLRVSPVPAESLHAAIAARIATDRGATVEHEGGRFSATWTR